MRILPNSDAGEYTNEQFIRELLPPELLELAEIHVFERSEYIYIEDNIPQYFYVVMQGRAKTFSTHYNGNVSIIEFVFPGDTLGDLEISGARETTVSVQAIERVICVGINLVKYKGTLLNNNGFMRTLAKLMAKRLVGVSLNFTINQAYSLKSRFARFILLSQNDGEFSEKLGETAEYLGVSYRHIQRIVSDFCNEGILRRRENRGYSVCDFDRLLKLEENINGLYNLRR